ncbi:hypothetical protein BKA93DRAFT_822581 [Sparassis latifolia]
MHQALPRIRQLASSHSVRRGALSDRGEGPELLPSAAWAHPLTLPGPRQSRSAIVPPRAPTGPFPDWPPNHPFRRSAAPPGSASSVFVSALLGLIAASMSTT